MCPLLQQPAQKRPSSSRSPNRKRREDLAERLSKAFMDDGICSPWPALPAELQMAQDAQAYTQHTARACQLGSGVRFLIGARYVPNELGLVCVLVQASDGSVCLLMDKGTTVECVYSFSAVLVSLQHWARVTITMEALQKADNVTLSKRVTTSSALHRLLGSSDFLKTLKEGKGAWAGRTPTSNLPLWTFHKLKGSQLYFDGPGDLASRLVPLGAGVTTAATISVEEEFHQGGTVVVVALGPVAVLWKADGRDVTCLGGVEVDKEVVTSALIRRLTSEFETEFEIVLGMASGRVAIITATPVDGRVTCQSGLMVRPTITAIENIRMCDENLLVSSGAGDIFLISRNVIPMGIQQSAWTGLPLSKSVLAFSDRHTGELIPFDRRQPSETLLVESATHLPDEGESLPVPTVQKPASAVHKNALMGRTQLVSVECEAEGHLLALLACCHTQKTVDVKLFCSPIPAVKLWSANLVQGLARSRPPRPAWASAFHFKCSTGHCAEVPDAWPAIREELGVVNKQTLTGSTLRLLQVAVEVECGGDEELVGIVKETLELRADVCSNADYARVLLSLVSMLNSVLSPSAVADSVLILRSLLPLQESAPTECPWCGEPAIISSAHGHATCSAGHETPVCALTAELLFDQPRIRTCGFCGAYWRLGACGTQDGCPICRAAEVRDL
ncbi:MAG: uncharacterized protein KVP18_001484 [Porospora cf. gigantea A]|uniref:uncharacterized protein n=1 Tax=Porospora cf. gigantea A TaxID=2853593 RepID=UPI00355AA0D1|nr:MAG: hypothetical protein KVP18_001484 [Porospora cf. gigantea A]